MNSLSEEVVLAGTVDAFKKRLEEFRMKKAFLINGLMWYDK